MSLARRELRDGIAEPADGAVARKDDGRIDGLMEAGGASVQFERKGRAPLFVVRTRLAGGSVSRSHELETLKTGKVRRRLTGSRRQSFFDGRRVSVNHHVAPRLTSASGIPGFGPRRFERRTPYPTRRPAPIVKELGASPKRPRPRR